MSPERVSQRGTPWRIRTADLRLERAERKLAGLGLVGGPPPRHLEERQLVHIGARHMLRLFSPKRTHSSRPSLGVPLPSIPRRPGLPPPPVPHPVSLIWARSTLSPTPSVPGTPRQSPPHAAETESAGPKASVGRLTIRGWPVRGRISAAAIEHAISCLESRRQRTQELRVAHGLPLHCRDGRRLAPPHSGSVKLTFRSPYTRLIGGGRIWTCTPRGWPANLVGARTACQGIAVLPPFIALVHTGTPGSR